MVKSDLIRIIDNFDEAQLEILGGVIVRMASVKAESWTGQLTFILNSHQGSVGDMHVNRGEVIRLQKKRGLRSSGV